MSDSSALKSHMVSQKDTHDPQISARNQALHPFNKLPLPNIRQHANILLLGISGVGKKRFAQSLLDFESSFEFEIRTATTLPLPPLGNAAESDNGARPRLDYLIFFVDMTSRLSFTTIQNAILNLHPEYFIGRSCLFLTRADDTITHAVDLSEIEQLSWQYNIPFFSADFNHPQRRDIVVNQLLRLLEVSCGYHKSVSPSYVMTPDVFAVGNANELNV